MEIIIDIIIPTSNNSDIPFNQSTIAQFEEAIIQRFVGFTRLSEKVSGEWEDQGIVHRDTSVVYQVGIASLLEGGKLRDLLQIAKELFQQEAIYFKYLGLAETYR